MRRLIAIPVVLAATFAAFAAGSPTASADPDCSGYGCPPSGGTAGVDVLPSGPVEGADGDPQEQSDSGGSTGESSGTGTGSPGSSDSTGSSGSTGTTNPLDGLLNEMATNWTSTLEDGSRVSCNTGRELCTWRDENGDSGNCWMTAETADAFSGDPGNICEFADAEDSEGTLGDYGWDLSGQEAWVCVDRWEVASADGTDTVRPAGCADSQRISAPVVCDGQTHTVTVRVYLRLGGPGAEQYTLDNPGPFESSSWTQTACEPGADQPPVLSWPVDEEGNERLWSADGSPYDYTFSLGVSGGYRVQTQWGGFESLTVPNYPDTDWDLEEHDLGSGWTLWLYQASDDPEAPDGRGPYRLEASGQYTVTWAELGQTTITSASCSQVTEVLPHPELTEPVTQPDGTVTEEPIEVEWRTVEDCTPDSSTSVTTVVAVNTEDQTVSSSVDIGAVRPRITE